MVEFRPGTKVTLHGGSEADILRFADMLADLGAPHALVYDEGHVEPPHFDGSRTLTFLGAGPFRKGEEPSFLRKLPLWRGGCDM